MGSWSHSHSDSFQFPYQFEKELEKLEQKINPALDDDAQVAFSYILGKAVEAMKKVPDVSFSGGSE